MRRGVGVLVMLATLVPFYNVGMPTLAIPFSHGMTAYASGIGDTCLDSLGHPPLLGLYGQCNGWVARGRVTAPPDPEGRYRHLEHAYAAAGWSISIVGPSYGAGRDRSAGKRSAVGSPTDVAVTPGPFEMRAAERPRGALLALGVVTAAMFLSAAVLTMWPRRTRAASSADGQAEHGP